MCSSCIYHRAWVLPYHTECIGESRSRSCDKCCWIADFPRKQCMDTSRSPRTCHKHWRQLLDPEIGNICECGLDSLLQCLKLWLSRIQIIFWQREKNHWVSWQTSLLVYQTKSKETNERTREPWARIQNLRIKQSNDQYLDTGKHWKSIVTMKRESDLKLTFFCDKSWQLLCMRSWVIGILIRILGSWFYKSYLKRSQQLSQFPGLIQFLNSISILAGKIVSLLITQLHFENSYPKQMTMDEDLRKIYLCGSKSVF